MLKHLQQVEEIKALSTYYAKAGPACSDLGPSE